MRVEYFLLVDRIQSLSIEEGIVRCEATVPAESTIYEGHFPGFPVLPGVLLIEAMAQTAGWLILAKTRCEKFPFLSIINEAKLRNFVRPGNELLVESKLIHEGSGYIKTENRVLFENAVMCEAATTFRVLAFPSPVFQEKLVAHALRIGFPAEYANYGR
jgi:3-hydroxyacyl-[acyl-carrier-protein] dehydratase